MRVLDVKDINKAMKIDEVVVYSMHSTLYTVQLIIGDLHFSLYNKGKMFTAKNLGEIRDRLMAYGIKKISIRQNDTHDEMLGIEEAPIVSSDYSKKHHLNYTAHSYSL